MSKIQVSFDLETDLELQRLKQEWNLTTKEKVIQKLVSSFILERQDKRGELK